MEHARARVLPAEMEIFRKIEEDEKSVSLCFQQRFI